MPRRKGEGIALLADPTRRRIIAALAIRPLRPSTLAAILGLSRPAVSHHLKQLGEAGLVTDHGMHADGRAVLYTLDPLNHGAITAWLAGTDVGVAAEPSDAAGFPPYLHAGRDPWVAFRTGPRGSTFDPTRPGPPRKRAPASPRKRAPANPRAAPES